MDEKEGKGGMQKAEWDAIIRVDGVRREELAGEQREISPEVERAEGRGQGAKEGKKTIGRRERRSVGERKKVECGRNQRVKTKAEQRAQRK